MWNHLDFSELHDYSEYGLITIKSKYDFFDIFLLLKEKFSMNIPDTAIMNKGLLSAWMFTSNPKSGSVVLKKKEGNLILTDFLQKNMPVPPSRDKKYSTIFQLTQYCDNHPEGVFKMIQKKIDLDKCPKVTSNRDKYYSYVFHMVELQGESRKVRIFSKQNKNVKRELQKQLLARERDKEQKHEAKPIFAMKTNAKNLQGSMLESSAYDLTTDRMRSGSMNQLPEMPFSDENYVYTSQKDFGKFYQLSFNKIKNVEIKRVSMNFVKYLEKNLFCRIREIKIKFIFDWKEEMYFIGFSKILVKLRTDHSLERILPRCDGEKGRLYIDINKYYKLQEFDDYGKRFKETKKKKLLKRKKQTKCKGFFCDYSIKDKVETVFAVKRDVKKDLTEAEKGAVKLVTLKRNKYAITHALLEKIEANLSIIDQILNLFSIVNPSNPDLPDKEDLSSEDKDRILASIKDINLDAESRESKLKHAIFKYKSIQVCKKCYNIITYIQGMLEKKLNDRLKKIRDNKTEKIYFKNYKKLENFSLKGLTDTQTTAGTKKSLNSGVKKGGKRMRKSASSYGLRKKRPQSQARIQNFRLQSGQTRTMKNLRGVRSTKSSRLQIQSVISKRSAPKIKINNRVSRLENSRKNRFSVVSATISNYSSKADISEHLNSSKFSRNNFFKKKKPQKIGKNFAKEITDITMHKLGQLPGNMVDAVDSLFKSNFSFLEFFSSQLYGDLFHRKCEEEKEWVKGRKKESRDEVIRGYRRWIRLMIFFKLHKFEPKLKKFVNIFNVLHMAKMKIHRESIKAKTNTKNYRLKFEKIYKGNHLKAIPNFKKSAVMRYPHHSRLMKIDDLKFIDFKLYCKKCKFDLENNFLESLPAHIRERIISKIRIKIVSEDTVVPFIFFEPADVQDIPIEMSGKNFVKQIVVVSLDLFGCFSKFIEFVFTADNSESLFGYHFFLINIPGQPFTIFDPNKFQDCSSIVEAYDQTLGKLADIGEINFEFDEFYFVGFGFGSLILSHLLFTLGHVENFKKLLSFNGIFFNNKKVKENTLNLIEAVLTSEQSVHMELLNVMNNSENNVALEATDKKRFISQNFSKETRLYMLQTALDLKGVNKNLDLIKINSCCFHSPSNSFSAVSQSIRYLERTSSEEKQLHKPMMPHMCFEYAPSLFKQIFDHYITLD